MSVLQPEAIMSFDDLESDGQAAELAILLDRMKSGAAQRVAQKASGQARENLSAIVAEIPDRPRNVTSIVAVSVLGGLTAVGMGLGAAAVFAGIGSAPFFGFSVVTLIIMGVVLAPMSAPFKRAGRNY
jgi:hypothetical protein